MTAAYRLTAGFEVLGPSACRVELTLLPKGFFPIQHGNLTGVRLPVTASTVNQRYSAVGSGLKRSRTSANANSTAAAMVVARPIALKAYAPP